MFVFISIFKERFGVHKIYCIPVKIGVIHVLGLCCVAVLKMCYKQSSLGLLLAILGIEVFGMILSSSIEHCDVSLTICVGLVKCCISAYLHG